MYLIKFKSGQTCLSKGLPDVQKDGCILVHLQCTSIYDFAALRSLDHNFCFIFFYTANTLLKKKSLNFITVSITF